MWYILQKKSPERRIYFLLNDEQVVGRKDAKILIENDASISRKHATLALTGHPQSGSTLLLVDSNSKYGSFVNGTRLSAGTVANLNNGDVITFGKLHSSWRVVHEPLVVTSSCLPNNDKIIVKRHIQKLGGILVSQWTDQCTFLIMNTVQITVKTISALSSLKHVVHPSFFSCAVEAISNQQTPSLPDLFLPPIGEPSLEGEQVDLKPCQSRADLFSSKTFIFFNDSQLNKLEKGIKKAKGKLEYRDKDSNLNLNDFVKPGICVMSLISSSSTHNSLSLATEDTKFMQIASFMKKNKKRMISEAEVGLAIVHASVHKFCNPDYSMSAMLLGGSRLQTQNISQQPVFAAETQEADILKDTPMSKKRKARLDDNLSVADSSPKPKVQKQSSQIYIKPKESDDSASNPDKIGSIKRSSDCSSMSDDSSMKAPSIIPQAKRPKFACFVPDEDDEDTEADKLLSTNVDEAQDLDKPARKQSSPCIEPASGDVSDPESPKNNEESTLCPDNDKGLFLCAKNLKTLKIEADDIDDDDGERNLIKVVTQNLLRPSTTSSNDAPLNSKLKNGCANFKKFKKKENSGVACEMITSSQLKPYVNDDGKANDLDDWCERNDIIMSQQNPSDDEDDYRFNVGSRARRR